MTALKPTEILTPPCRLAFPSLFIPTPVHPTTPDKLAFQATILVPPEVGGAELKRAIEAACVAEWGKVIPLSGNGMPVKKCDGKYSGFDKGWLSVKAKSKYMPEVVDQAKRHVFAVPSNASAEDRKRLAEDAAQRVYAGCWCRFYISAFAWDNAAGKGVSFNLSAVQLVKDGPRLDGRKSADELFDEIDTGDVRPAAAPAAGGDDFFGGDAGGTDEDAPW